MKKLIKISLLTIISINLSINTAYTEELSDIKDNLQGLGVSEEYSQKIVNYIGDLKVTESDFDEILSDSIAVYNEFNEKSTDGVTLSEIVSVYDDINKIADNLKLDIGIDIINKEVEVKSKDTNEVIFKVDKDEAVEYYNNLKELPVDKNEFYDFLELAKENIIVKDNEFNDYNEDNIVLGNEEDNFESNFVDDIGELLKKISDDSSILAENEEEIKNIKDTEDNISDIQNRKIYGGVFIVLAGCTVLAVVLGSIFKIK